MADTALNDDEIKEIYDSPEELDAKIETLAGWFRKAKHPIVYTGAGVSTGAGIPDFRGPNGVWTRKAKAQRGEAVPDAAGRPEYAQRAAANQTRDGTRPTLAHMAIVTLFREKLCKFLISSNCDNLHLKSGVQPADIVEVHGNGSIEACSLCGRCYHRGLARVRECGRKAHGSRLVTGRLCDDPKCKGVLRGTVVAFGQSMPDLGLAKAEKQARRADLCLTLGTSMRVFPSCDLPCEGEAHHGAYHPRKNPKGHKLVLVNLQRTPYDDRCALRIFAKTDDVMAALMKKLGLATLTWDGPAVRGSDFIHSPAFLAQFADRTSYPFRSAGDRGWIGQTPHVVATVTPEVDAASRFDLMLRQTFGEHGDQVVAQELKRFRATKAASSGCVKRGFFNNKKKKKTTTTTTPTTASSASTAGTTSTALAAAAAAAAGAAAAARDDNSVETGAWRFATLVGQFVPDAAKLREVAPQLCGLVQRSYSDKHRTVLAAAFEAEAVRIEARALEEEFQALDVKGGVAGGDGAAAGGTAACA
eukprot:g2507.t1